MVERTVPFDEDADFEENCRDIVRGVHGKVKCKRRWLWRRRDIIAYGMKWFEIRI